MALALGWNDGWAVVYTYVHLHLSQLLITLDWIITSISINKHKNRVLELGSSLAL